MFKVHSVNNIRGNAVRNTKIKSSTDRSLLYEETIFSTNSNRDIGGAAPREGKLHDLVIIEGCHMGFGRRRRNPKVTQSILIVTS